MNANFQVNASICVLIPDGESFFALPTLQCLGSQKNIKIYVLADEPHATIRYSRYTTRFFSFPKEQGHDGRLAAIINIVKKNRIDLVLPIDQPAIRYLSEHRNEILKYTSMALLPDAETFDIASNKWLLAEWLKKNKLPVPATLLYEDDDKFEETLQRIPFPALIKPIIGDGGIGIKFFETPSALISFCKDNIRPKTFIVQSFIMGYDIDCSVLCKEGNILASTIQKRIIKDPFYFGQTMNIDFLNDSNVYNVVKEIIHKLNWSGVVHFDLRYDEKENQAKVIEMNPRFWGSIVGSYYAGVNFPYLATLLGLKKDLPTINFQQIRYVDAITAIKITIQRIFFKRKAIKYYDHSKLMIHLKDPLPMIISGYIQICKKIRYSLKKETKAY